MRKILALLAILVAGGLAFAVAEETASSDEPDLDVMKSAAEKLSAGDFAGFDLLLVQASIARREQLASILKSQEVSLKQELGRFGRPIGADLIEIKEFGRALRRYYFLTRYEDSCIRWRFDYYRPRTDWIFAGYDIQSDEGNFFSESAHSIPIAETPSYSGAKSDATSPR